MPFHDLEKECLEELCLKYKNTTSINPREVYNDISSLVHFLLVRKERENRLEDMIYKLAEAVNIDLDNLE